MYNNNIYIYINIFDTTTHNIIIVACTYSIIYVPQLSWIFETAHIPTFADDADNNPLVAGNMPISHVLGTSSQQFLAGLALLPAVSTSQRHGHQAPWRFQFLQLLVLMDGNETSVFACFCHQKYMRSKVFLEASPGW